jgi:hypothetical protein
MHIFVGTLQTDDEFLIRFLRARKLCVKDALEVYENYFRFLHRNRELCFGLKIEDAEVRIILKNRLLRSLNLVNHCQISISFILSQ